MAPGRAADVSQDSACCRADGEPTGLACPDDVKLVYMYRKVFRRAMRVRNTLKKKVVRNLPQWSN